MTYATVLGLAPEFNSPHKLRRLDVHEQPWTRKQRWGYRRSLQKSWAQSLLSWQRQCQGPPWCAHTPLEPIFCTNSVSNTCPLPQDSSWEAWQVPWCLSDGHTHLICKPPPPALEMCQRMEQLLVHSPEEFTPLERVVSMRFHPTSMSLATSVPNLPSAQGPQFCSREFLPVPSNQQLGMPTWKPQGCPQEAWAPKRENQTADRGEDGGEHQAPRWGNQRESREGNAGEPWASGRQLLPDLEMGDDAEAEILGWGNQRLVISETDGDILTPGSENQDQMGSENRTKIQELGKRNQREAGGENPPETQAHRAENQEQLRCKIDPEAQTPEGGDQDGNGGEDAVEIQAFERKTKKKAGGKGDGEIQAQGLGKQGQTGGENGEETQMPGWGKQAQHGGDDGAKIQAEERGNKDWVGVEDAVHFQTPGRENVGEVKEEDGVKTQALEWGKQEWAGSENVPEIQTPGWENQDQGGSKKASGENEIKLRLDISVGRGNQNLRKGEDAGETQMSQRKKLKEIREEDWLIIQAPWWGSQRVVADEIDREFEIPCWGNQGQIGREHRAEIWGPEKREQREGGGKDDTETWAPEADNQRQLRGEAEVETHPPGRRNLEQFGDKNGADMQAPGKKRLRGVKGEVGKETQALGEENQGQLRNEISGKIHPPKWKNQELIRSKDGTNTQAYWGKLTTKIDAEAHTVGWKKEEQIESENRAESQALEKRNQREAGGEDGTETLAPGEENQGQLRSGSDRDAHLSEWKNQEQMGGKNGTEIQAPETRNQREAGGEDGVETQRPERENQGQLDKEIDGESSSPRRRNWEQPGGENGAENQASEKRNQREVGRENGTKFQRLGGENQKPSTSNINGKTYSSEWKNHKQIGGENDTETQIQEKRNLKGTEGDDGSEIQAPGGDYQGELGSEINTEIQTQGRGNQNTAGSEDATEIREVGSHRKCGAEDAGGPQVPRDRKKNQVRGKDAAKANLQVDCAGGEVPMCRKHSLARPSALTGSGCGAMEQGQAKAVNTLASAPGPEMKHLPHRNEVLLLASGEEENLASRSTAPVQGPQLESQRGRPKNKDVAPGKASSLTWQPWNPQSVATLGLPSACPSLQCGPDPQAAAAFGGTPTALTVLPKGPVLKKSKQQLLDSLMRRKIAHLKWGLPQRILQSYLLLNVLGPCPLPIAEVRPPGLYTGHEFHGQKKSLCEAQGSRPGPKPPEKPQRVQPPGKKRPELPTQTKALEKCGLHWSEPQGTPIHPEKPRRAKPPGGARDPQAILEEVLPRSPFPAPRNPRPEAESGSWRGQEKAGESSSETSSSRKMVRPEVSQTAERAPSRGRTPCSRAGDNHWREERPLWEVPKPPRRKLQQPTYWRRGSLEPVRGGGAGQQPPSCSADPSSFKGGLQSAAVRLSKTLLNKMSRSPPLAKSQHTVPHLSLQDPDPSLLPQAGDPHTGEGNIGDTV
ncbi:uncharacterized protein LOC104846824 [Loxodonta africana]